MKSSKLTVSDKKISEAFLEAGGNKSKASLALGMDRGCFVRRLNDLKETPIIRVDNIKQNKKSGQWVVETDSHRIETVEDVIRILDIDTAIWRVKSIETSAWDVSMKIRQGDEEKPFTIQNTKLKVVFERMVPKQVETAISTLLKRIEVKSPTVLKIPKIKLTSDEKRNVLEIALMDIHYGLRCFKPESNAEWNPELAEQIVMASLKEIVELVKGFGPFEELVLPMGNDFFHSDSFWGETTLGTRQPEADAYYHTFTEGLNLAIRIIMYLQKEFKVPIKLIFVPGNHDRNTSFMLGQVLKAYYRNDPNIFIDASTSPYKFYRFGLNLIGYEHGHSVAQVRLAALMANECPKDWSETQYREWHLGDQHRKGSSKPCMLEEQGVSVEYLPSITAPNEWHHLKSFNWQKRGTLAYVWNFSKGQIARVSANVDRYVNALMGVSK